jgi:hypothetical protein
MFFNRLSLTSSDTCGNRIRSGDRRREPGRVLGDDGELILADFRTPGQRGG